MKLWNKLSGINLPNAALDNARPGLCHVRGEFGLVVVLQVGVGNEDKGSLDHGGFGNGAGSWTWN